MDHEPKDNPLPTEMTTDDNVDDTSFRDLMLSDYDSDEETSDASPLSYPRLGLDTDSESDDGSSETSPKFCVPSRHSG
jgi:hypothetical protein